MTLDDADTAFARLTGLAPVDFRDHFIRVGRAKAEDESRLLDGAAAAAARLASYLGARSAGLSHDKAVAKSNRVVRKVRKALGCHITRDLTY